MIAAVAPEPELRRRFAGATRISCDDGVVTPGFVDSHTHALFGVFRTDEYVLRARGVPYLEIARQGGGINATVRDVRARHEDELVEVGRARLREVAAAGTTTVEIKSGYGLRTEDELKLLRVIRRLQNEGPLDIVATFLGAHDFPPEYRASREAYVDVIIDEMIPAVAAESLAAFCDVFMEPGAFTREQARRILETGSAHGLVPKLHADEFEGSSGAELAVELGAVSADHLGAVSDA